MTEQFPPHVAVVDDFLPADLADRTLAHALAQEAAFQPARVRYERDGDRVLAEQRQAMRCDLGLGALEGEISAFMLAQQARLAAAAGVKPFAVAELELELVAHRDGHYFKKHVDTFTGSPEQRGRHPRMLSTVIYLHRQPKGFSGGEISFSAYDRDQTWDIAPRHNRVAAFASFDPHEVKPTVVPGDAFADSRFSVNCWYLADRPARAG